MRVSIAEIIPAAYDGAGRQVSPSFFQRKVPHAALPIGRYVSQPLTVKCEFIHDVRRFLAGCRTVSAQDLFGKRDHWQPPEEFERLKKGGWVDFSLWTWRQLLSLGYDARFVGGSCGRYGAGHAWVEYFRDGKCFLLEPQLRMVGDRMPRLTTLRYKPKLSVTWDGETLKYFVHKGSDFNPSWRLFGPLVWEWLVSLGMVLAEGDTPSAPVCAKPLETLADKSGFARLIRIMRKIDGVFGKGWGYPGKCLPNLHRMATA